MCKFAVTITSDKDEHIEPAVRLAMAHPVFSSKVVRYYCKPKAGRLELHWGRMSNHPIDSSVAKLPYDMGVNDVVALLKGWFLSLDKDRLSLDSPFPSPAPDTDGTTVTPGWTITTDKMDPHGVITMETTWIVDGLYPPCTNG